MAEHLLHMLKWVTGLRDDCEALEILQQVSARHILHHNVKLQETSPQYMHMLSPP